MQQTITLNRVKVLSLLPNSTRPVGSNFRVSPYYTGDIFSGITIYNFPPISIWSMLQLKDGDILQGINGKKFMNVDEGLMIYSFLETSSNFNIQIQRESKTLTINYVILENENMK